MCPDASSRLHMVEQTALFLGRVEVSGIDGEEVAVEVGPHGRFAVQGALDVIGLKGDHFADADDEIDQSFSSGPVVADADEGRFDVGMKDGSQHFAFGALPGIVAGQLDFHEMLIAPHRLSCGASDQSLNMVFCLIDFRRFPMDRPDFDQMGRTERRFNKRGIRHEPACSNGETFLHRD